MIASARRTIALTLVAVAAAAPLRLSAQSWRTIDVARQLADSAPTAVNVVYGTGTFALRGTTAPLLYHMQLRYDAERSQPRHSYDRAKRRLDIGVQKSDMRFTGRKEGEAGKLQIELSRAAQLDLSVDLGAAEADLDLTGLRLRRLRLEAGASESRVRFDSLNANRMELLEVSLGAASFRASRLANANAATIRVDAGVGNVELDMGGQWNSDIALHVEVALGVVTIHVPPDVGIRATVEKVIAGFEHEGLVQRGNDWVSSNWDSAPRKLCISAETTLGKLAIDRTGR
jgi:hypothetical protein